MLPMGLAPKSGGELPTTLHPARVHAYISPRTWRSAAEVAQTYLAALRAETAFSTAFQPCIEALATHIETATGLIARLDV